METTPPEYDYQNFTSDYLCPHCGGLLYVDNATPRNDACINSNCQLWPSDFNSIIDATESEEPRIHKELQVKEQQLISEIKSWKPGKIARYAYTERRELVKALFTNGMMPDIDTFIALGELLLLTNKYPSEGQIDDTNRFVLLVQAVKRYNKDQCNLEDVQTRRFVFGKTGSDFKILLMKYDLAFAEFQKDIGLVNQQQLTERDSMFSYRHLEAAATPDVDYAAITDHSEILDQFWITSLQLRYWLQSHYRTKLQYNYTPDLLDFTVLYGWCRQIWGKSELSTISSDKESKEMAALQSHFDQHAEHEYSVESFVNSYIDSTELVPIVARTPEGWLIDFHTLLFFLIYLQGCPDPRNPAIRTRGQLIQDRRGQVAERFEGWLRDEVRQLNYTGPNTAVIVNYEYDIIAISEERKTIIMADAKYRDMAPSSYTGTNIIQQELLGDNALKYEANRQQQRLDYFRENTELFNEHLNPQHPWEEYTVHSFLATKIIPLVHRYKEVRILRAKEFLETLENL
ncbi:hypothetical protein ACFLXN_02170 [Chloroflexota bacterium]